MSDFDELFQFGQATQASKAYKNNALFAGIGGGQVQGQGGMPTDEEDIFSKLELDVNFTATPLPNMSRPGDQTQRNQLIDMLSTPSEPKMDFKITENHYSSRSDPVVSSGRIQGLSSDSVGFEANKSWFQRYIFDFTRWSHLFQTNTRDINRKLTDSFWPFIPENQPNYMNCENEVTKRRAMTLQKDELYGPIWIMITLIIELLILGHVSNLLRIELGFGSQTSPGDQELVDQLVSRFGSGTLSYFDPTSINANESLKKIITLTFIVVSYFAVVPFAVYMLFRSSSPPSDEISFLRIFMLYAYSMAVFIPGAAIYTAAIGFSRVRWVVLIGAFACTSYFQFKETIDIGRKYLTFESYKKMAGGALLSNFVFCLLLKFYFIGM